MRSRRGCLKPPPRPYKLGDYEWNRCPKRAVLDNPWIGAAWASDGLVTLSHSNRAHDAHGIAKSAEAWRRKQEFEEAERQRKAASVHAKAKGR